MAILVQMGDGESATVYAKVLRVLSRDLLRQPSFAAGRSMGGASKLAPRLLPLRESHPKALDPLLSLHSDIPDDWEDDVATSEKCSAVQGDGIVESMMGTPSLAGS